MRQRSWQGLSRGILGLGMLWLVTVSSGQAQAEVQTTLHQDVPVRTSVLICLDPLEATHLVGTVSGVTQTLAGPQGSLQTGAHLRYDLTGATALLASTGHQNGPTSGSTSVFQGQVVQGDTRVRFHQVSHSQTSPAGTTREWQQATCR